jgi:Protein of unknown function (Hypoth_ymh)
MPFGPSTTLANYYLGIEDCLQDDNEIFALIVLELLQECDRHNQTNPPKTNLTQSTITEPVLSVWFATYRPNDHQLKETLVGKLEDAWRWLHVSNLIKPEPGMNGQNGYVVLTDLGRKTTRNHRALLEASRVLPENLIHSRILARIRADFRAGYYDKAVQDAFKQIEEETRTAASLELRISGEDVFKRAFAKESPLYPHCSKPQDEMQFFSVSYRIHRHPPSHGNTIIEPKAAVRMVVLASHLLDRLDEIRARVAAA